VYAKSLGRRSELGASSLSPAAVDLIIGHAEQMLDLLHAVLRRDWPYLQDMTALGKLFPCTEAGARSIQLAGMGLSVGDLEQLRSRSLFLRSDSKTSTQNLISTLISNPPSHALILVIETLMP